jgi:hypothetical protein
MTIDKSGFREVRSFLMHCYTGKMHTALTTAASSASAILEAVILVSLVGGIHEVCH